MKKIFFFAAAVVAMAACQKGAQPSVDEFSTPQEDGTPEVVQFSTNVQASVKTKAQGGVDAWNKQGLKIYGYERVAGGVNYLTAKPLIDNVTAEAPVKDATNNVLTVLDTDQKPFYYEASKTYDFYGYYIDDLEATPMTDEETKTRGMYVDLTLTGGEDIMVAKADQATDYQTAVANGTFTGKPGEEWKTFYAYSAYAARRGVHPTLTFKHQLVRFRFQITSGSDVVDGKPLTVTNITMKARNEARLYVTGATVGLEVPATAEYKELSLRSLVDGKLETLAPKVVPDKDEVVVDADKFIGESLMVIANEDPTGENADKFELNITTNYDNKDHTLTRDLVFNPENMTNPVAGQTKFTAGYSYVVNIVVYSPQEIKISAELEEWIPGGTITDDTDDAPQEIL